MRYFIGIDIPAKTKLAIQEWRDNSWAQHRDLGSVPAANFHITLAFLGQISEQQLDKLHQQLSMLNIPTFEISIEQFNVWQKPPMAWIGCSVLTDRLIELQRIVIKSARIAGISMQEREYVPHITLARKCKGLVSSPLLEPNFSFEVEHFCLFESVSTPTGVTYPIREQWPLSRF